MRSIDLVDSENVIVSENGVAKGMVPLLLHAGTLFAVYTVR